MFRFLRKSRKIEYEDYLTALSSYRHYARYKYDVLNLLFGIGKTGYISPDDCFTLDYVNLHKRMGILRKLYQLENVPTFEYKEFVNIELNYEYMLKIWTEKEVKILQDLAELEALYLQETKGTIRPFESVIEDLDLLDEDIERYKKERNKKQGYGDVKPLPDSANWDRNNPLLFHVDERHQLIFPQKSNIQKQFSILAAKNGDYELVRNIKSALDISNEAIRSNMSDLRGLIEKQGLTHVISIDTNKKGAYKLSYLLLKR